MPAHGNSNADRGSDTERLAEFLQHFEMKLSTEPCGSVPRLTQEAFGSVSKTYIRAKIDKVLSPALQARMLTSWRVEQTFELESGHFPLMSTPTELVSLISKAANTESVLA